MAGGHFGDVLMCFFGVASVFSATLIGDERSSGGGENNQMAEPSLTTTKHVKGKQDWMLSGICHTSNRRFHWSTFDIFTSKSAHIETSAVAFDRPDLEPQDGAIWPVGQVHMLGLEQKPSPHELRQIAAEEKRAPSEAT